MCNDRNGRLSDPFAGLGRLLETPTCRQSHWRPLDGRAARTCSKDAPRWAREDREMVLAAARQSGRALEFAAESEIFLISTLTETVLPIWFGGRNQQVGRRLDYVGASPTIVRR